MAEQTIILNLEVDQAKAGTDLQKTEKALLDLKEEQKELNAEYKKGNISQDEYVKHNLKLQQSIKKESDQKKTLTKLIETESGSRNALRQQISSLTKEYDNLNTETAEGIKRANQLEKELGQLSAQLTKGDKAAGLFKNQIGNYPAKFGDAISSINIAGTSVGSLTAKLAAFANPATAVVSIVGALGAAYARSTIGAKDLEFAQNQLSAAISISTNKFAELISSAEDGEGIFSKLASFAIGSVFGFDTLIESNLAAFNLEKLDDLARDEEEIRGRISDRLAENQEFLTAISDEQTSLNDKLGLTEKIEANLRTNQGEIVTVLGEQLKVIEDQLRVDQHNEGLLTQKVQKNREINKVIADTEKKIQANERLQNKILADMREEERIRKRIAEIDARPNVDLGSPQAEDIAAQQINEVRVNGDAVLKIREDIARRELALQRKLTDETIANEQKKQDAIAFTLRTAAAIFDEQTAAYRILASADALVNTYKGANLALASYPPPFSYIAMAATIAAGLANVAQINGVQFAEGGYTGPGRKHDPAGVVHAGEVVWSQKDVALAGGPMAADSMRPTSRLKPYADGGFVTNTNISPGQQSLIMANALKNMPNPVVSWTEGRRVGRRVEFREKISRA